MAAVDSPLIGINAHRRPVWQTHANAHAIAPRYGAVLQPMDRFNCCNFALTGRSCVIAPCGMAAHPDSVETIREAPGA
jgi:hypothetical protein